MALKNWSTVAGDNDDADATINWAENQAPSTVNNSARAMMAALRSYYEDVEWRDWGHTVTRTGNTTFTVPTDVTAIYVANRPIRCTDSSTLYGYIVSSSYGAPNTTVTVSLDSGNLSASLTAVSVGPIPSNQPISVQSIRNGNSALLAGANAWTGNQTHAGTETFNAAVAINATQTNASTDAGATIGPEIILDRNSASPAASDVLGGHTYKGRDSGGGTDTYVQTQAEIVDHTAASEDGRWTVKTVVAGTLADRFHVGQGVFAASATGGDKGAGTANFSNYYKNGSLLSQISNTYVGFIKGGGLNVAQNATRYFVGIGNTAASTEANGVFQPAYVCTIYELHVHANAAVAAGQSAVITVRKNGVNTSVTCTLSEGQTDASDTSNSFVAGPTDDITVQVVTSATFGSTTDMTFTLRAKLLNTSIDCGFGFAFNSVGTVPGAAAYSVGDPLCFNSSSEAALELNMPQCVLRRLSSTDTDFQNNLAIRKNAATHYLNSSGVVQGNNQILFAEGDLFNLRYTPTDGATGDGSLEILDPTNGDGLNPGPYPLLFFGSVDQVQNATRYMASYGRDGLTTESESAIVPPACTIRKLRINASSAPAAGQTIIVTVRKNGVDTTLTATITDAGRGSTDSSHSVTFNGTTDTLTVSCVTSATSGTRSVTAVLEAIP